MPTSLRADAAPHREAHRETNSLRDVILGGQDGLVNILGIVLGVIAAGGSTSILLATGFAAAITESISMGAVGYTSSIAERDYYDAERQREAAEIQNEPDAEREELRAIYRANGFEGDLLEQVVTTLASDRERWLDTEMNEELHLRPHLRPMESSDIVRTAVVIGVATLAGHMIPLLPFVVLARTPALVTAIVLSGIALFGVGAYSAITLVGDWRRKGFQMLVIGLGAAAIGFVVGRLFHASGA